MRQFPNNVLTSKQDAQHQYDFHQNVDAYVISKINFKQKDRCF